MYHALLSGEGINVGASLKLGLIGSAGKEKGPVSEAALAILTVLPVVQYNEGYDSSFKIV